MKFNPTWPQVAMLAVLLAAILLSYAFVAPAAGTITGIVSTILGSLFINFQAPASKDASNKDADQ